MSVPRAKLDDTLKRRFFFDISFSIYGGVSGLYDYGPPGVALKKNIIKEWESHFVLEDDLLEIEASQLTTEPVLKASGHVDRFADYMVKDVKTGDCYRLDHLIKDKLEKIITSKDCDENKQKEISLILSQLDGYTKDQSGDVLKKFDMKAPTTGNDLSEPVEFNLMFSTSIGPTGLIKSFLRPETAQGIFVNFKRLLEANQGRLPFGVAQVGKSFRNEISPRGGLTRMREFTMCEIEYFVDPTNKTHAKFQTIKNVEMNLYSACNQMDGESFQKIAIGKAVENKVVANEVLAYFMTRIQLFMLRIGIDPEKMRFRQHMSNEMAHYASDCWDCELLTSTGWLECVGCADRACYDLTQHSNTTKVRLTGSRHLKEPKEIEVVECLLNKQVIGKSFKKDSQAIVESLTSAKQRDLDNWEQELNNGFIRLNLNGKNFDVTKEMVSIHRMRKVIQVEEIVPNVIEPSFGIDRIFHSLLEHSYKQRENDANRTFFSFPPAVAPIKCSVLPLSNNEEFAPFLDRILTELKKEGIRPKVDASGESIGKRYARTDEIGIPFGITIDFDTIKNNTVTLRYCLTTEQLLVDITKIVNLVKDLVQGNKDWSDAKQLWPIFTGQSSS